MKGQKLFDAVTNIDEGFITQASTHRFRSPVLARGWKTAAVAACLTVAIILGIAFGPDNTAEKVRIGDVNLSAYALAPAQYPETVSYPQKSEYGNGDAYYEAYRHWKEHQKFISQNYPSTHTVDTNFIKSTVPVFLGDAEGTNPVYSPLSLYMALAMTAEITDGNSRQQLLELLGEKDISILRTNAKAIWNRNYKDDGVSKTILANSVWLNQGVDFNRSALDTLSRDYYTDVFSGNMSDPKYTEAFQYWLNKQTSGLLNEYISEILLEPRMLLVLASTVYFKSKWDVEFSQERTSSGTFYTDSEDVTCNFLNGNEINTYYWGEKFTAAQRSFEESGSMLFILPDEDYDVGDLTEDPQVAELISGNYTTYRSYDINFSIPKFDISSKTNLIPGLEDLGVVDIFSSQADFSPLINGSACFSKAEQGVRVAIDEVGCEAASYTVMAAFGGEPPTGEKVDFVLDRPFIFVIRGDGDAPLFVGIVNDPTKTE